MIALNNLLLYGRIIFCRTCLEISIYRGWNGSKVHLRTGLKLCTGKTSREGNPNYPCPDDVHTYGLYRYNLF
jgi:hypothetical protein